MSRVSLAVPAAVGAIFGAASTRLPGGDPDLYWHLVAGRDTLAHGLARVDVYSWTVAGRSVSVDQWLGQVLWALAANAADWRGIVALRALAVAALVALVVYGARRERPARPLVAVLVALPAIALSRFVWTERPELFGFVCFAALIVLVRASRDGSDRALVALPVLMLVWSNLHGSFALGAALILGVAIEGALAEPARRGRYALAALASLLLTLATPAGLGAWTMPSYHFLHPPREIQEWSLPDVTTLPGLIFALALFATFASALFGRSRVLRDGVVLLPVLFISLTATRQLPLFPIAAAPYLAQVGPDALAALIRRIGLRVPSFGSDGRPPTRRADGIVIGGALVALALAGVTGTNAPEQAALPAAALTSLRSGPGLFDQYDWGGFLIYSAPGTPVFVDGRLTPYLPDVIADYTTVLGVHPGWREVLARRGVRQLLVRPTDPIAVRARDLGWVVRARSDVFVLFDVP